MESTRTWAMISLTARVWQSGMSLACKIRPNTLVSSRIQILQPQNLKERALTERFPKILRMVMNSTLTTCSRWGFQWLMASLVIKLTRTSSSLSSRLTWDNKKKMTLQRWSSALRMRSLQCPHLPKDLSEAQQISQQCWTRASTQLWSPR